MYNPYHNQFILLIVIIFNKKITFWQKGYFNLIIFKFQKIKQLDCKYNSIKNDLCNLKSVILIKE